MADTAPFPANKSELVELVSSHQAQPFHLKVFLHNQFATNFSRWTEDQVARYLKMYRYISTLISTYLQDDSVLHVSHNVTNYEFFYEPFYVSLDSVPRYDERFVGYGFTRNTQVKGSLLKLLAMNLRKVSQCLEKAPISPSDSIRRFQQGEDSSRGLGAQ